MVRDSNQFFDWSRNHMLPFGLELQLQRYVPHPCVFFLRNRIYSIQLTTAARRSQSKETRDMCLLSTASDASFRRFANFMAFCKRF